MTSHVVKKERCPECAKLGKDTKGDNLVSYSDGHSYCFGCGFTVNGDSVKLSNFMDSHKQQAIVKHQVFLPTDCTFEYPNVVLDWVGQYDIRTGLLLRNRVMWS